jgi:hypothetical protein
MATGALRLLFCLLVPVSAFAQWNAGAFLGGVHTRDAGVQVTHSPDTDVMFDSVSFADRSFNTPLYYGLRGGYRVTPIVGVEAEFIHLKAFARVNEPVTASGRLPGTTNITTTVEPAIVLQQYDVSHGLNLLFGNVVLRTDIMPRLDITLRAGLGMNIAHPEILAFGQAVSEYQVHGPAIQFAGGAEVAIVGGLFWLGEYKFTTTKPRFTVGTATIENSFSTHHLVTGLGFRFR